MSMLTELGGGGYAEGEAIFIRKSLARRCTPEGCGGEARAELRGMKDSRMQLQKHQKMEPLTGRAEKREQRAAHLHAQTAATTPVVPVNRTRVCVCVLTHTFLTFLLAQGVF